MVKKRPSTTKKKKNKELINTAPLKNFFFWLKNQNNKLKYTRLLKYIEGGNINTIYPEIVIDKSS